VASLRLIALNYDCHYIFSLVLTISLDYIGGTRRRNVEYEERNSGLKLDLAKYNSPFFQFLRVYVNVMPARFKGGM